MAVDPSFADRKYKFRSAAFNDLPIRKDFKMLESIWKKLPLKLRKALRRWWRLTAWIISVGLGLYHAREALDEAWHAPISRDDLNGTLERLCNPSATTDVGTLFASLADPAWIAISAFIGYFADRLIWAAVVVFMIVETRHRIHQGLKRFRLWRNRRGNRRKIE